MVAEVLVILQMLPEMMMVDLVDLGAVLVIMELLEREILHQYLHHKEITEHLELLVRQGMVAAEEVVLLLLVVAVVVVALGQPMSGPARGLGRALYAPSDARAVVVDGQEVALALGCKAQGGGIMTKVVVCAYRRGEPVDIAITITITITITR